MKARGDVTIVTERGQVSIPARLREELAIHKGRRLLWQKAGEREIRLVVLEPDKPRGAVAMLGFARRFRPRRRRTADWMKELREGER
jgi:bifunctional DNA-binding transcriptional regulator/antitoxin component of YhaV-PrlF toxin-antitoxin module